MVIEEKMKLNKFQQVSIPKPSDMFARLGARETPSNQYTGEEMIENANKVESLGKQMEMYTKYAEEEAAKAAENNAK